MDTWKSGIGCFKHLLYIPWESDKQTTKNNNCNLQRVPCSWDLNLKKNVNTVCIDKWKLFKLVVLPYLAPQQGRKLFLTCTPVIVGRVFPNCQIFEDHPCIAYPLFKNFVQAPLLFLLPCFNGGMCNYTTGNVLFCFILWT